MAKKTTPTKAAKRRKPSKSTDLTPQSLDEAGNGLDERWDALPKEWSISDRQFFLLLLDGETGTAAYGKTHPKCKARYRRKLGSQLKSRLLRSVGFEVILGMVGISDELIAQRLAEGINAHETKFFQHLGKVKEQVNVVNFAERRQYLELVMRAKRLITPAGAPVNIENRGGTVNVTVDYGPQIPKEPTDGEEHS